MNTLREYAPEIAVGLLLSVLWVWMLLARLDRAASFLGVGGAGGQVTGAWQDQCQPPNARATEFHVSEFRHAVAADCPQWAEGALWS